MKRARGLRNALKSTLKIRKTAVFEEPKSFMELTIRLSFNDDPYNLVDCPFCGKRHGGYTPCVDSIQIENSQPRDFISDVERKLILNQIKSRVQQIMTNLSSCVTKRFKGRDECVRSLFYFYKNYVFLSFELY